jgi:hypothetical protein
VIEALAAQRWATTSATSPAAALHGHPQRHRAAAPGRFSTREAEENCAVMVVDQLRDFLEHGNVVNAVNFPAVRMARESRWRVAIANANVPNMLGQISTAMANAGLNIHNMVNKSRGAMAYTLVDVESPVGRRGAGRMAVPSTACSRCATCQDENDKSRSHGPTRASEVAAGATARDDHAAPTAASQPTAPRRPAGAAERTSPRSHDDSRMRVLVLTGAARPSAPVSYRRARLRQDNATADPYLFEDTVDALEALPLPTVAR